MSGKHEFEEMRRKDRLLTAEEAEAVLIKAEYGILSTVCEDGYPYSVPISYAYADGKLYFHHSVETSLLNDNIARSSKVCFTVVGATEVLPSKFSTVYESVIAFGTIRECEDKIGGLMKLVDKYSPDFQEEGRTYAENAHGQVHVYEMTIDHMTGKARKNK